MPPVVVNSRKPGAPKRPTPKEVEIFVGVIADGGTLNDAAKELGVNRSSLTRWLREDEEGSLKAQYARAREEQADIFADEMNELRRKVELGSLDPQAARVIADALKWEAGKRKPAVYGDKLSVGGASDLPPIKTEDVTASDEAKRKLAALIAAGTRHTVDGEPESS